MSFITLKKQILKSRTTRENILFTPILSGFSSVTYVTQTGNIFTYCDRICFFNAFISISAASGSPSDVKITGFPFKKRRGDIDLSIPIWTDIPQLAIASIENIPVPAGSTTVFGLDTVLDDFPEFILYHQRSATADLGGKLAASAINSGTFNKNITLAGEYFSSGDT